MIWKIKEAQQQFSEIIKASGATPQVIYQSDRPFVAVIRADLFQEFLKWQQKQQPTYLAEAFEELHQICLEENYTFEIPIANLYQEFAQEDQELAEAEISEYAELLNSEDKD